MTLFIGSRDAGWLCVSNVEALIQTSVCYVCVALLQTSFFFWSLCSPELSYFLVSFFDVVSCALCCGVAELNEAQSLGLTHRCRQDSPYEIKCTHSYTV